MKKKILVPGVAAALLCNIVVPSTASAQQALDAPTIRELIAVANALGETTDGDLSSELRVLGAASSTNESAGSSAASNGAGGGDMSPVLIAAIVLGVLGAAGAGGFAAVQQGWVKLPPDLARTARQWGLPVPAPAPTRGSCSPQAFDAVVPTWPKPWGTTVSYCDGKWAIAGANGTDWIVYFKNTNGKWGRIPADGQKATGMHQECFNGIKLRQQGAPEAFLRKVPICTPAEIGK